jgi:acyl carrier protein
MTTQTKNEVIQSLADMITEVVGDEHFDIEASTSFRDELAFQSIQFVALAELIQDRWVDLDFVSWITGKQVPELLALRVGDVADFIVGASAGSA